MKSNRTDVSIIVPVYNAQATLERCIDSVLKQTYTNFELLLVDDGSKDDSGKICDAYACRDERIMVIHKANSGVSDSRNQAMEAAHGQYLQFLDSDDWLTPESTGLMLRAAKENQCDMVIADFYRVKNDRVAHKGDIKEAGLLTREDFAMYMMENPADFYYGVLWNKLYRRDIIEKHRLRMDSKISWCEDFMFNLEYMRHMESVYVLPVPVYYYVKTKGSLVSQGASISKTLEMKQQVFEYYNQFYQEVFDEEVYEKSRRQVYRFLIDVASDGIMPPLPMPDILRLGEERTYVSEQLLETTGILYDQYRERKLVERNLELIALQYDLEPEEAMLLLYLYEPCRKMTRRELTEVTGLKSRKLLAALRRLAACGYIIWKETSDVPAYRTAKAERQPQGADLQEARKSKNLDIQLLDPAQPVIREIGHMLEKIHTEMFQGFTEEEAELYRKLDSRIKENIKAQLS